MDKNVTHGELLLYLVIAGAAFFAWSKFGGQHGDPSIAPLGNQIEGKKQN